MGAAAVTCGSTIRRPIRHFSVATPGRPRTSARPSTAWLPVGARPSGSRQQTNSVGAMQARRAGCALQGTPRSTCNRHPAGGWRMDDPFRITDVGPGMQELFRKGFSGTDDHRPREVPAQDAPSTTGKYPRRPAPAKWLFLCRLAFLKWLILCRLAFLKWLFLCRLAFLKWLFLCRLAFLKWLFLCRLAFLTRPCARNRQRAVNSAAVSALP
jgi:hypothetical protein